MCSFLLQFWTRRMSILPL